MEKPVAAYSGFIWAQSGMTANGPAADCPLLSGRSVKLKVWLSILTFDAEPGEFYNSVHEQTVFDIEAGKLNGLAFDNSVIN